MATVRHNLLLFPTLAILGIASAAFAWAQDKSAPPIPDRSRVVAEPGSDSILVDQVPDRQRPPKPQDSVPSKPANPPKRLPPVNDLATPHAVVPHRLEGEYSQRKQSAATKPLDPSPQPVIDDENVLLPMSERGLGGLLDPVTPAITGPAVESSAGAISEPEPRGVTVVPQPQIEMSNEQVATPPTPAPVPQLPAEALPSEIGEPESRGVVVVPQPQIEMPNEEVAAPRSTPAPQFKPRVYSDILPQALRGNEASESGDVVESGDKISAEAIAVEPVPQTPLAAEPIVAEPIAPGAPSRVPAPAGSLPVIDRVIQEPSMATPLPALPHVVQGSWSPWWQSQVQTGCHLDDPEKVAVDLNQLITIALHHSPLLEIIRHDAQSLQSGGYPLSRLTLRYGRPRPAGCDPSLVPEQIFLARHRTSAQSGDTCSQTADHLLQIADAYWNVYRLRGLVAIGQRHHDAALALYEQAAVQHGTASDRQRFVMVEATIRQRRANLNSLRIALKQAQNELAYLVSVPGWQNDIELMPQDVPCQCDLQRNETQELELALTQRAEVQAAIGRLGPAGMHAEHQFASSRNRPSMQGDLRASQELEVVMDLVRLDVKDAMLKLRGNFAQMRLESETADKIAEELAVLNSQVEGLQVQQLLEAQERLQIAESNFLNSLARYNVAILQLRRANGTLFVETPL